MDRPGAQHLRRLRPYGLDRGGLALEILVLGVVDAVPAVEAVNLLVNAETDNAPRGEGLCQVSLAGAGDPDEQDGGRLAHDVVLPRGARTGGVVGAYPWL